jgi:biotin operon repressor
MRNTWKLRSVEDRLIKDLKESTLSFAELGRRYGVSRQAIFAFCQGKGIKRPKRLKREHTQNCSICQSLIRISKKPHSDFICSHTIRDELKIHKARWLYHLQILRKQGLISQKLGRLKSRKAEKAYQIYFKKRLPVSMIGRQVGLNNFYAIIKEHRALGWDVPDPLFTYDSNDRKKTIAKMNRKKKRG